MHPRSKAGAVAVAAAVFLAALATAGAAATQPKQANPCRLVKTADVEKVFDSDDVEADGRDASGFRCIWEVDGGLTGDGPQVSVTYETGPDAITSFERFSDSGKPVPGIGDRNYYSDVIGFHVLSDDEYIVVEADYGLLGEGAPPEKQRKKKIIALAKRALARQ